MNKTKEVILKLKEVKEQRGLSLNEIVDLVEKNGDYISRSSVQRVFSDGSEDVSFRYEETIRPIANALLDIDTIEDSDNMDIQAMKTLLQYKNKRIEELESQLDKEKLRYHEKLEKERERFNNSIEFLKKQVALKDRRIDILLDSIQVKDAKISEIIDKIMKGVNHVDH
jgi:transcriptional regulator with XRE-family HTH domain